MSFPRYPEYKDSGVEWLGAVPEHWKLTPVKNIARIVNGYPFDSKLFSASEGYPLIRIRDLNQIEANAFYTGEFVEAAAITSDDVLIGMDGDFNVGRWRGANKALLNQRMCCIRGCSEPITRLLEYALPIPLREINNLTYATTVKHLSSSQVEKTIVALPLDNEELYLLLAFLDRETAKLDELMAEQEKLIALLKEKRQAVISHAVTKGLDPTAPMKDSGVEWLGEVPKHWSVMPLGALASMIQTGPFGSQLHSEDYLEDETPVINPSNIRDGKVVPDWSCTVGNEIVERLAHHQLKCGDIVFGRRGEMGRCAMITENEAGWLCGTGSLNVRLASNASSEFVSVYLATSYVRELLKLESVGSTMDNLNGQILSRIPVPNPPLDEQIAIANFVGSASARMAELIQEAEHAIGLLKERRTALISAAVTGQIDVRGLVKEEQEQAA